MPGLSPYYDPVPGTMPGQDEDPRFGLGVTVAENDPTQNFDLGVGNDQPDATSADAASAAPAPGVSQNPQNDLDERQKLRDYMSKKYGTDVTKGQQQFEENQINPQDLQAQQDRARQRDLIAGLSESAAQIGNYRGQYTKSDVPNFSNELNKSDQDVLAGKQQLAKAGQSRAEAGRKGLADLTTFDKANEDLALAHEKRDPDSEISKGYRESLKSLGLDVPDTMTADAIERTKMADVAKTTYAKRIQMEGQADIAKYRAQEQGARAKEASEARQSASADRQNAALDAKNTKRFDDLSKLLKEEAQSSRSTIGKAANGVFSANKITSLLDQADAQGGKLTNPQMAEIASSIDSMIKGGASTVSGTEHMMPKTLVQKYGDMATFLTSNPQPQEMKLFIKQMRDTVEREKSVSNAAIDTYKKKSLSSYHDLQKADPEKWNDIMAAYGLNENDTADLQPSSKSQQVNVPGKIKEWTPPVQYGSK